MSELAIGFCWNNQKIEETNTKNWITIELNDKKQKKLETKKRKRNTFINDHAHQNWLIINKSE